MHGLDVQTMDFHSDVEKLSHVQTHFLSEFSEFDKKNILGPSALQALSISSIYFTSRRDIFLKNREEDVIMLIVIVL